MTATRSVPKTCGLAIASLICSVGSFIIIPLGFIPGIICGHLARKKVRQDPQLGGAGLAKAGLIVGYVSLGLHMLLVAGIVVFLVVFGRQAIEQVRQAQAQQQTRQGFRRTAPPQAPVQPGMNQPEAPGQENIDTTPDGSGWSLKVADLAFPSGPVSGRVHGTPFQAERVELQGGWLKFRQGAGFIADLQLDVVLFVSNVSELNGKSYSIEGTKFGMKPHIWMYWKGPRENSREQKSVMNGYSLRLEFGQAANGQIPGKIYLCLPDTDKSFIRGEFVATLK